MRIELKELFEEVDNCEECRISKNRLQHILGGGKEIGTKAMFVFINPTHRNITSKPEYSGKRFPFIGTTNLWKIFVDAGLLENSLLDRIHDAEFVINSIDEKGFYFTNLVKCTQTNADLPNMKTINKKIDLLMREINIVNPKLIVTFGTLPFGTLAKQKLKLSEHYKKQLKSKRLITYKSKNILEKNYKIFPCYFPVGRGRKKEALKLLKILKNNLNK